jgi:hypothetical protein
MKSAAAELNGAGIRFYGDVCLVLKPAAIAPDTKVLDRNSYDVLREPFRSAVDRRTGQDMKQRARRYILMAIAGSFEGDLKQSAL